MELLSTLVVGMGSTMSFLVNGCISFARAQLAAKKCGTLIYGFHNVGKIVTDGTWLTTVKQSAPSRDRLRLASYICGAILFVVVV